MKKCFTFLSVLISALAISVSTHANEQLTVYDNVNEYSNTSPINLVYLDEPGTRTQVLYPASALADMIDEPINSMTFYLYNPGITISGGLVRVALTETTQNAFSGGYFNDGLTTVARISMTEGVTELVITFDTPYMYHGGNLVFDTYVEEVTDYSFDLFEGVRTDYYATRTRNEVAKFIPKTTFDFGTSEEYASKVTPTQLTFPTIRAERQDTLSVYLKNTGMNEFTPTFSVEAPFYVDLEAGAVASHETLEVPIRFAPTEQGTFTGTLTIDCGPAGTHQVALHGNAKAPAVDLTVGDESDYGSYVPLYCADIDIVGTWGQVIYPNTMLTEMVGGDILGLKFHTYQNVQMDGGVIQLSLREMGRSSFTRVDPVVDMTVVATVVPVLNSTDLEFVFDQPYHYEGGHLAVECLVTEPGITNYRQTFFYGTVYEESYQGLAYTFYGEGFDYDLVGFLPEATFTFQKDAPLRGDVNGDKRVTIADVTALISLVLSGEPAPSQADCNLDENINIGDVTALISYVLSGSW